MIRYRFLIAQQEFSMVPKARTCIFINNKHTTLTIYKRMCSMICMMRGAEFNASRNLKGIYTHTDV